MAVLLGALARIICIPLASRGEPETGFSLASVEALSPEPLTLGFLRSLMVVVVEVDRKLRTSLRALASP